MAFKMRNTAYYKKKMEERELNYKKAFIDAIKTSRTTINTQIKGQQGYKKDDIGNVSLFSNIVAKDNIFINKKFFF